MFFGDRKKSWNYSKTPGLLIFDRSFPKTSKMEGN